MPARRSPLREPMEGGYCSCGGAAPVGGGSPWRWGAGGLTHVSHTHLSPDANPTRARRIPQAQPMAPASMSESERQISRSKFAAAVEADSTMALKSAESKDLAVNIMAKYDRDGNGQFDLAEVVDILEDLQDEQKDKLKAQKQVRLLGIIFVVIVSCLGLFVGLNAAVTWMTVDSAKDTETSNTANSSHGARALLTDRDGHLVASTLAETTLPLIAAPALDLETLATTERLVVTYPVSGTSTVTKSLKVTDVVKYSDTWAEFEMVCGISSCAKVVVKDGAATYYSKDDTIHEICVADMSCSAFTVNEEAEREVLLSAAYAALNVSSAPSDGRRRLDSTADCALSTTSSSGYAFTDEPTNSATKKLRAAVELYIANPAEATTQYGDISTWDTSLVTDMSVRHKRLHFSHIYIIIIWPPPPTSILPSAEPNIYARTTAATHSPMNDALCPPRVHPRFSSSQAARLIGASAAHIDILLTRIPLYHSLRRAMPRSSCLLERSLSTPTSASGTHMQLQACRYVVCAALLGAILCPLMGLRRVSLA